MLERLRARLKRHMPTREQFERSRWLRPVAHIVLRPDLWRFHRRSVPRGVALGILVGVLVPVAQTIFAALLALPARANVPVAAGTTLITNPLTTPAIWAFSYMIGRQALRLDAEATGGAITGSIKGGLSGWLDWMLHVGGPALGVGLVIVAVVGATLGYMLAALGWRLWIARQWAARGRLRHQRRG